MSEGTEAVAKEGGDGLQQANQTEPAGSTEPASPAAQAVTGDGTQGDGGASGVADYQAQLAERDARIDELEAQVAAAAKAEDTAKQLQAEIDELKKQGSEERVEFELMLAGCRNVKAARAVLDDHGGDIAALKEAEPWLFVSAAPAPQPKGKTGLPNAGASHDGDADVKRWRRIAGLDE